MEIEKTVLQNLIDRKSDRLLFDSCKGKSVVWNNFVKVKVDSEFVDNQSCWRDLAAAARGLLGVPATSTSSERSFSLAGRTIEERRTQLSSDSVDGLLVLHGLKA